MRLRKALLLAMFLTAVLLGGCQAKQEELTISTPSDALDKLIWANEQYVSSSYNGGDISKAKRKATAEDGESPYAVIVACSDCRVAPEHIFSAGIGDLYVIRTAGNVIGDFELESIEYGVDHLGAKLIVVLGHSDCSIVAAALEDQEDGYLKDILAEVKKGLAKATEPSLAEYNNIVHSMDRIKESKAIWEGLDQGQLMLVAAKYNLKNGQVEFYHQ